MKTPTSAHASVDSLPTELPWPQDVMIIETHLGTFKAERSGGLINWSWQGTNGHINPFAIGHTEITPATFVDFIRFVFNYTQFATMHNELGTIVALMERKYRLQAVKLAT